MYFSPRKDLGAVEFGFSLKIGISLRYWHGNLNTKTGMEMFQGGLHGTVFVKNPMVFIQFQGVFC